MKKPPHSPGPEGGMTLIEILIIVMIMSVIFTIAVASFDTLMAKVRYTRAKADMNGIAYAGYMDYTNNLGVWSYSPDPLTPPPNFMTSGILQRWPEAPCFGWYYSWDSGESFGLNVIRVSLRRQDDAAIFSYCVNTYGGGECDAEDLFSSLTGHGPPIEISASTINHIWCNE